VDLEAVNVQMAQAKPASQELLGAYARFHVAR
jgi:hypothetical protein